MRGRWERGSGGVLPSEVPYTCMEKRFPGRLQVPLGKHLDKEQAPKPGLQALPRPHPRLGLISLCLGEIFLTCGKACRRGHCITKTERNQKKSLGGQKGPSWEETAQPSPPPPPDKDSGSRTLPVLSGSGSQP